MGTVTGLHAVALFVGLTSCSSDGDETERGSGAPGGACESLDVSCGGDLVGSWELMDVCMDVPVSALTGSPGSPFYGCAELMYKTSGDADGTFTFAADGSYSGDSSIKLQTTIEVPKSCLNGRSCTEVAAALGSTPNYTDTISDLASSCRVVRAGTPESSAKKGAYAVSGNRVTTTDEDGPDDPGEFCVRGSDLVLKSTNDKGLVASFRLKRR